MTETLYKFEPCLEVSKFSRTIPGNRRNGMISILILEWFVILFRSQSGDKMTQGTAGFSRDASSKSSKSRDNQKSQNVQTFKAN